MGTPSFGSFGPSGPGFGSIQNAPATGVNPTAFPTAPPPPAFGGGSSPMPTPQAPQGLGNMVGQSLGNLAGVNLQPQQLQNQPTPQPFRSPLPQAPPPLAAAPTPTPTQSSNPFANVNIPQGLNGQVAEPRGGLSFQQWNALTPEQRSTAGGILANYQAGNSNNMTTGPNGTGATNPTGLALQNAAASQWQQMYGPQSGQQSNSLFGLGG